MEKPENAIVKLLTTLLNQFLHVLKSFLASILGLFSNKKPPVDLHKPPDIDPKQKKNHHFYTRLHSASARV